MNTSIIQQDGKYFLVEAFGTKRLVRSKPKYCSWPNWLGGKILDDKYWPAYKIHDQMRGKDGKTKFPYIKSASQAHSYLGHHLSNLGCNKILIKLHLIILNIRDRKN